MVRAQPLTWRRLAEPITALVLVLTVVGAICEIIGAVVAGAAAQQPSAVLVGLLAVLLLGGTALDTVGRTALSGVVGRAEGRLRADLLHTALHQTLPMLEDQAVGELLDRVDDDARQLGVFVRRTGWTLCAAALRSVLAWVVAGLTWWPAWIAFPLTMAVALLLARPLTPVIAQRKLAEEVAWSDHSAQLEEAVAGRDDVRSSLGQPHVVRQYVRRAQRVLERVAATAQASVKVARRTGLVLYALLAALAVAGVLLVGAGRLDVAELVTLWLLVTTFVGQASHVSNQLPELQAGLGALHRIRALLAAPQEPVGGEPLPAGPATVEIRALTFGYPGGFTLRDIDLTVPAGTTCAVVGRTGAGKSTLAKLLSRAVEPPPGTVFVAGQDVTTTDLEQLRQAVGVVTQRTEILAATLEENITLFTEVPHDAVVDAVAGLGLEDWVAALPDGLQTRLGAGGATLSAGEQQLVAFARLLVRDVAVVVLDEATARMDPQTERRVTRAAERLLAGRTGVLIAHRLSTTRRADTVAVLDDGRLVQRGERPLLATTPGPFQELLAAAGPGGGGRPEPAARTRPAATPPTGTPPTETPPTGTPPTGTPPTGMRRSDRRPRPAPAPGLRPRLAHAVARAAVVAPQWGLVGGLAYLGAALLGTYGVATGWLWGQLVAGLERGAQPWPATVGVVVVLMAAPFVLALAFRVYPLWWNVVTLQLRLAVLLGQTRQRRLARIPAGEVVARALDSDRFLMYVDRWVDVVSGVVVVVLTAVAGRSVLAGVVIAAVLVVSALVSGLGAPLAGAAARVAGDARARFGAALVSVLDAAHTVKLAAATTTVQRHLGRVDAHRVAAIIRELRVRILLEGTPGLLVQTGVVVAWTLHLTGRWDLATTLLVSTAVSGAAWFGVTCGAAVTEAPVARRWLEAVADLSGGTDLLRTPPGVDLVAGTAPPPPPAGRVPLKRLGLQRVTAVHDDGTVGVHDVDLTVDAGSLVLVTGAVGAGKSSLLGSLAGLVDHEGSIRWNDLEVDDPQLFLRPGQVAYVGQVPRVLSGSFTDNIALDHRGRGNGALRSAVDDARMRVDVDRAGGDGALVGHRGVRLSGGQVQRLALARALATGAELLVADDVSSALDARTEVELWEALRDRGITVVGASSKRAALARADCVVVLADGRVAATGPWSDLVDRWGHLAS